MDYLKQTEHEQYIPIVDGVAMVEMHTTRKPDGKNVGSFWFNTDPFDLMIKLSNKEVKHGRRDQGCNCND
jgi:hypothetical protein